MSKRKWTMVLDGESHEIVVDHGYFSARCQIFVDGSLILDERPSLLRTLRLWNTATEHPFTVAGHACSIRIDPTIDNMTYRKQLIVDSRDVDTGASTAPLPVMPTGSREGAWLAGYGGLIVQPFAFASIVLGQVAADVHSQPALWVAGFAGAGVCWSAARIVGDEPWRKVLVSAMVVVILFLLARS